MHECVVGCLYNICTLHMLVVLVHWMLLISENVCGGKKFATFGVFNKTLFLFIQFFFFILGLVWKMMHKIKFITFTKWYTPSLCTKMSIWIYEKLFFYVQIELSNHFIRTAASSLNIAKIFQSLFGFILLLCYENLILIFDCVHFYGFN